MSTLVTGLSPENIPAQVTAPIGVWHNYIRVYTVIATVLMYSGFAFGSYQLGLSPLPYQVWFGLLLFGAFPIIANFLRQGLQFPLIAIWSYAYLLISIAWVFVSRNVSDSIYGVSVVIVYLLTMLLFYLTFATREMRILALWSIFGVTLFSTVVNVVQSVTGAAVRPGGLHIDPNTSSCALVMGMIVTTNLVPPKYRIAFQLFVLLGVVATLSRGGLVEWASALLLMYIFGRDRMAQSRSFLVVGVLLVGFIISPLGQDMVGNFLTSSPQVERIFGLGDKNELESDSRFDLLQQAMSRVEAHPFLGSGTNQTQIYQEGRFYGPHNMYLSLAMQFGIWGALFYPALGFVLARFDPGRWSFSIPLAAVFLIVGMFDHNVLVQWHYALIFALVVRMDGTEYANDRREARPGGTGKLLERASSSTTWNARLAK